MRCLTVIGLSALILLALTQTVIARIDDPAYHHLDEIYTEIFALQDSFPQHMRVDSIGHSQQENLPIYSVWITDDVEFDEDMDKPSVVINGSLHAEEVLGVEYAMWLINKMVALTREARNWRQNIHTYIIPISNPEGLRAVYEYDYSYRKNKRDNIGDGHFRYKYGWGGDTSGVDINRNFPTFWIHGDKFLAKGTNELYDYYRGPSPASEAETRALMGIIDQVRPLYSLTIHSSRTGSVAEKVIYPWGFGQETKLSPDIRFMDALAHEVARRCESIIAPGTTYEPNRVVYPRGDAESYYYWKYGVFGIRVEIGAGGEAMQPDSAGIYRVIDMVDDGLNYLLNSAAGVDNDDYGLIRTSRFEIKVIDAATGSPLEARLVMDKWATRMIPYRTTNPRTGMYYWLATNSYRDRLTTSKFGYELAHTEVSASSYPIPVSVRLNPLPWFNAIIEVNEEWLVDAEFVTEPILDPVDLTIEHPDSTWSTTIIDGSVSIDLPQGYYELSFYDGTNHVPRTVTRYVDSDTIWSVTLDPAVVLFEQTFDGESVIHTSDNIMNLRGNDSLARWELTDDLYHSPPRCLTDSRRGNTIRFEDGWDAPYNLFDESFNLSSVNSAALVFWLNQALEPDYDSMWVEVSTGGPKGSDPATWEWEQVSPGYQELAILNYEEMDKFTKQAWDAAPVNLMQFHDWQRMVVSLDDFTGENRVHFRFHLRTDGNVEEDGVYIDDVCLLASADEPPSVTTADEIPKVFRMGAPYPNPFNGQLSVTVDLSENDILSVTLYDMYGRLAQRGPAGEYKAGSHRLVIDGSTLPSGLYFVRAEALGKKHIRKVVLVK